MYGGWSSGGFGHYRAGGSGDRRGYVGERIVISQEIENETFFQEGTGRGAVLSTIQSHARHGGCRHGGGRYQNKCDKS